MTRRAAEITAVSLNLWEMATRHPDKFHEASRIVLDNFAAAAERGGLREPFPIDRVGSQKVDPRIDQERREFNCHVREVSGTSSTWIY